MKPLMCAAWGGCTACFWHMIMDCLQYDVAIIAQNNSYCVDQPRLPLYQVIWPTIGRCDESNDVTWKRPLDSKVISLPGYNSSARGLDTIFIKRRKSRQWADVDEFRHSLPFPTVTFDPGNTLKPKYAVTTFKQACLVVGYHGAGLANAILARNPVVVVELTVRRFDNNKVWRSNCRELKHHPTIKKCIVMVLKSEALNVNSFLWPIAKHAPDHGHVVKLMPSFKPNQQELSRLQNLLTNIHDKYCST